MCKIREDVRKKLIEVARKGETITYMELIREFRIPRGHWKPGIGIGSVVGEISNYEYEKGRPLLSAIVVLKSSRTRKNPKGHPSGGFFGLKGVPDRLRRRKEKQKDSHLTEEELEFVRKEQEKVWNYWKKHL